MHVAVNFDTCENHAQCVEAAPEIFEIRDDGYLYILNETPDESLRVKIEAAVRLCPTQSISIVD